MRDAYSFRISRSRQLAPFTLGQLGSVTPPGPDDFLMSVDDGPGPGGLQQAHLARRQACAELLERSC